MLERRTKSESLDPLAAARAHSLSRRLASRSPPLEDGGECGAKSAEVVPRRAERRFQRWLASLPFETPAEFERRLGQIGTGPSELRSLLAESEAELARRLPEPHYRQVLEQALEEESVRSDSAVPTRGLLAPASSLITQTRRRLERRISGLLTSAELDRAVDLDPVLTELERWLCLRLEELVGRSMTLELHAARLSGRLDGSAPEERFRSFCSLLRQPKEAARFWNEYPVLAASVVTTVEQWLDASADLIERWCDDRDVIGRELLGTASSPRLTWIRTGLGDPHCGGRSVGMLGFDDGRRVVYKPRSLAVDRHFRRLIDWLASNCPDVPDLRAPAVVERAGYGWVEYIEPQPNSTIDGVESFYRREGALLALLWVLGGADMHHENVIAAGDQPVIVDPETLFHPRIADDRAHHSVRWLAGSVLSTGLLPMRLWTDDESEGLDLSAMSGRPGQMTPEPVPRWAATGTDEMRLVREKVPVPTSDNLPTIDGEAVDPLAFREQLLAGFDQMAEALWRQRERLLAEDGPLCAFADDEVRVVLRPTRAYASLARESCHPELLRDGLDRDRFFDHLYVGLAQRPWLEPVLEAERRALWRGDVPRFHMLVGRRDLAADDGEVFPDFLPTSPLEEARARLLALGGAERQRQRWMVDASLSTLGRMDRARQSDRNSLGVADRPIGSERWLAAARDIAYRLLGSAFRDERGASWLGVNLTVSEGLSIGPIGFDLYDGLCGVTLFLATYSVIAEDDPIEELASSSLTALIEGIDRNDVEGVGGFVGWGGILYAASHLEALWPSNELTGRLGPILDRLADQIAADSNYDVIAGVAGLIGGLRSLYRIDPDPRIVPLVRRSAEHLCEAAIEVGGGLGWPAIGGGGPLTGFSHGAAGFAWALDRAAELCAEPRFAQAADRAIAFERAHISRRQGNWFDLRGDEEGATRQTRVAWCHGAPGIGLQRLTRLAPLVSDATVQGEIREFTEAETETLLAEVEIAVETTLASGFGSNHCLCHGDLGNLELLIEASKVLPDRDWEAPTNRLAAEILAGLERHGPLTGVPLQVETPGLLVGLAGIGYQLLRLAAPGRVPSILRMEPPRPG